MSLHNLLFGGSKKTKKPQTIDTENTSNSCGNSAAAVDSTAARGADALIAQYSRGSVALQQAGGYMTKEEKDALKREVLKHRFA